MRADYSWAQPGADYLGIYQDIPAPVSHGTGWAIYLTSGDARPPGTRNAQG